MQTVFQLLDYGDELQIEVTDDRGITLEGDLSGVPAEQNLCWKAASLLQNASEFAGGARIFIEKKLPVGAGLGGGSSDAATTLRVLNQLWNCRFDGSQLARLGLQLGADVPVFVHGQSAWAEGLGEKLEPLDLPQRWFVVVKPAVSINTAKLFSHPQLTRNCSAITIVGFRGQQSVLNVFEPLARNQWPEIDHLIAMLNEFAQAGETARLTGSGACVFLPCSDRAQAQSVLRSVLHSNAAWSGFVACGVNESPLNQQLVA